MEYADLGVELSLVLKRYWTTQEDLSRLNDEVRDAWDALLRVVDIPSRLPWEKEGYPGEILTPGYKDALLWVPRLPYRDPQKITASEFLEAVISHVSGLAASMQSEAAELAQLLLALHKALEAQKK